MVRIGKRSMKWEVYVRATKSSHILLLRTHPDRDRKKCLKPATYFRENESGPINLSIIVTCSF